MDTGAKSFINEKFNLPLFMISRIPLKENRNKENVRDYIDHKKRHYLSTWDEELIRQHDSYTIRKNLQILGLDKKKSSALCEKIPKITELPSKFVYRPWQLAPNRYGLEKKPFACKAGAKGAHWAKIHTHKPRKTHARKPFYHLYYLPRETEKMDTRCHKNKSIFLSNARERKPSTRGMLADLVTTYKDPNAPGPTTYDPEQPGKICQIVIPPEPPQPDVFYPNSVVPVKKNVIHPPNISFLPGPGRYEIRYKNLCPCSRLRRNKPELDLIVDRQKRNKFRRLPYTIIKRNEYCSPDWRHVLGNGYPHLFMGAKEKPQPSLKAQTKAKEKAKQLKLYHDAKYINMILDVKNNVGSFRTEPMPSLPTKVKFDRMAKVVSRKQLKINRKLAFGSKAERWAEDDKPPALTPKQVRKMLDRIAPERRLRDYPIMDKDPEEIESQLYNIPDRLRPNYIPKLRKRNFKFLPLPGAKILIDHSDIRPKEPSQHGLYLTPLDQKKYSKD